MATNRRAGRPANPRCTDDDLFLEGEYAGARPGNVNGVKEVRAEAVKVSTQAGPKKTKPEKVAMAKADVIKGGYIGQKDGSVGVITHQAIGPINKAQ